MSPSIQQITLQNKQTVLYLQVPGCFELNGRVRSKRGNTKATRVILSRSFRGQTESGRTVHPFQGAQPSVNTKGFKEWVLDHRQQTRQEVRNQKQEWIRKWSAPERKKKKHELQDPWSQSYLVLAMLNHRCAISWINVSEHSHSRNVKKKKKQNNPTLKKIRSLKNLGKWFSWQPYGPLLPHPLPGKGTF